MANISIKLNLTQLRHVEKEIKGKNGMIKVLIIPVEENKLYDGEKNIYLDMIAFEMKNKDDDSRDTHILKQSFDKETRDAMSDDEKQSYPILGNAIDWGKYQRSEPEPRKSEDVPEDFNNDGDDLPF